MPRPHAEMKGIDTKEKGIMKGKSAKGWQPASESLLG